VYFDVYSYVDREALNQPISMEQEMGSLIPKSAINIFFIRIALRRCNNDPYEARRYLQAVEHKDMTRRIDVQGIDGIIDSNLAWLLADKRNPQVAAELFDVL
jgi:hypothetical protein